VVHLELQMTPSLQLENCGHVTSFRWLVEAADWLGGLVEAAALPEAGCSIAILGPPTPKGETSTEQLRPIAGEQTARSFTTVFGQYLYINRFELLMQTIWSWKWRRRSSRVAIEPSSKTGSSQQLGAEELERGEEDDPAGGDSIWISYRLRSNEVYHKRVFSQIQVKILENAEESGSSQSADHSGRGGERGRPQRSVLPELGNGLSKEGPTPSSKESTLPDRSANSKPKILVAVQGSEGFKALQSALAPGGFVDQLQGVLANLVLNPGFVDIEAAELDLAGLREAGREVVCLEGDGFGSRSSHPGSESRHTGITSEGVDLFVGESSKALGPSVQLQETTDLSKPRVKSGLRSPSKADGGRQERVTIDYPARGTTRTAAENVSLIESVAALRVACASTPKERCALSQLASHIPALKARGIFTMLASIKEDEKLLGAVTGPLKPVKIGSVTRGPDSVTAVRRLSRPVLDETCGKQRVTSSKVGAEVTGRKAPEEGESYAACNAGGLESLPFLEERTEGWGAHREGKDSQAAERSEAAGKSGASGLECLERGPQPQRTANGVPSTRKGAAARALNAAMRERVSMSLVKRAAWVDQGVLEVLAGAVFDGELFQRLCQERALVAEIRSGGGVDSRSARSRKEGGGRGDVSNGAESARAATDVVEVRAFSQACCFQHPADYFLRLLRLCANDDPRAEIEVVVGKTFCKRILSLLATVLSFAFWVLQILRFRSSSEVERLGGSSACFGQQGLPTSFPSHLWVLHGRPFY
jgi:hypothetical protein